jgi:hypothetical protein
MLTTTRIPGSRCQHRRNHHLPGIRFNSHEPGYMHIGSWEEIYLAWSSVKVVKVEACIELRSTQTNFTRQ